MGLMWYVDRFYNKMPALRWWISRLLFGNEDTDVKLFGLTLLINTIKENGYLRASNMCSKGSLLRDEVSILLNLSALLSDGDTFVDVGANIGVFSSTFSRYSVLFQNFHICAFEANPDTYERLEENARRYGFEPFNYAISNQEGELEFVLGAVSHVFTTVENASQYHYKNRKVKVPCKRLDQFDLPGNSLVLKIDVEGQELNVLQGAKALFEENKIKAVYLDGFAHQEDVLTLLRSYGFSFLEGKTFTKTEGRVFSLLALRDGISARPHQLPRP